MRGLWYLFLVGLLNLVTKFGGAQNERPILVVPPYDLNDFFTGEIYLRRVGNTYRIVDFGPIINRATLLDASVPSGGATGGTTGGATGGTTGGATGGNVTTNETGAGGATGGNVTTNETGAGGATGGATGGNVTTNETGAGGATGGNVTTNETGAGGATGGNATTNETGAGGATGGNATAGNETATGGNATAGNETATGGNATAGNETATGGNATAGNETGAGGATGGNATAGNETATGGNATAGNETGTGGNATAGNETAAGGNATAGNETGAGGATGGNATAGNETATGGNATAGNETAAGGNATAGNETGAGGATGGNATAGNETGTGATGGNATTGNETTTTGGTAGATANTTDSAFLNITDNSTASIVTNLRSNNSVDDSAQIQCLLNLIGRQLNDGEGAYINGYQNGTRFDLTIFDANNTEISRQDWVPVNDTYRNYANCLLQRKWPAYYAQSYILSRSGIPRWNNFTGAWQGFNWTPRCVNVSVEAGKVLQNRYCQDSYPEFLQDVSLFLRNHSAGLVRLDRPGDFLVELWGHAKNITFINPATNIRSLLAFERLALIPQFELTSQGATLQLNVNQNNSVSAISINRNGAYQTVSSAVSQDCDQALRPWKGSFRDSSYRVRAQRVGNNWNLRYTIGTGAEVRRQVRWSPKDIQILQRCLSNADSVQVLGANPYWSPPVGSQ